MHTSEKKIRDLLKNRASLKALFHLEDSHEKKIIGDSIEKVQLYCMM